MRKMIVVGMLVVALVGFFVPWGGDGRAVKEERLSSELPLARASSAVAVQTSQTRQTPTVRLTYPFEVTLAEGVRPRELKGLVARAGVRIVSYLPRGGAIVEATDAQVTALRAMPAIAAVGECEPLSKFAPGFRERLVQAGAEEAVRVSFSLINAADAVGLAQQIVTAGGIVLRVTDPKSAFQWLSAELPAARIAAFADRAEVKWIEPISRIRWCNATAVKADRMDVERAWDKGDGLGLSGAGQVIGHMDTGIDFGTTNNLAPEFAGHIKAYFDLTSGTALPDTRGHGTHTAGSIVGQGVPALGGKFRGVAHGAELVHHALGAQEHVLVDDLNAIFAQTVGGAHSLYPGRYAYPTNTQMTACGPNPDEGWGEIGVAATLAPTNGLGVVLYDARLDDPTVVLRSEISLYVTNSTQTLTVALSWIDYPSDPSSPGLVNDYNLELFAPDGTVYYPNGLNAADADNVHEVTVVTNAMAGLWTAAIRTGKVGASNGGAVALYARGALGTEEELPFEPKTFEVRDDAHLTEVLNQIQSGDTLKLAAGRYTPFEILNRSLTVIGAGVDKTVIDGGCTARCVNVRSPGGWGQVVLSGVTIQNGYAVDGAGFCGGTLRHSVIRNCRAALRGGGAADAVLDHCVISNCWVEAWGGLDRSKEKGACFEGGGAYWSNLYDFCYSGGFAEMVEVPALAAATEQESSFDTKPEGCFTETFLSLACRDRTGTTLSYAVTNETGELVVPSALCERGSVTVSCVVRQGAVGSPDGTLTWVVETDSGEPTKSFYLDPSRGSVEGTGTFSAPFLSFTNAIAAAEKAAETNILIYVDHSKEGHCFELDETINVDVPDKKITFLPWETIGSGPFDVMLDGQGACGCVMVPDSVTNSVTFKNFILTNGYDRTSGGGAYRVTLVNCTVVDCKAGANGGGVSGCNLTNCVISSCVAEVDGGGAHDSLLCNCLVVDNAAPKGMGGGAICSSLYNCTLDGNTARYGGGFVSSTKTTNEVGVVEVVNSIILDNGTDNWTTNTQRQGDEYRRVFTAGDPKFVDAAHGDFRLRADSPCIDSGYRLVDLPTGDLDGNPRLRGAGIDLGCYEFQRHAAFPPGTLDVSTNAQVIGSVLYAQGPWRLAVDDGAKSWLSADVTSGSVSNTLRFTFAANTTGADRSAVVSVFTNGSAAAVQQVTVRQVGRASGCAGTRRGVFIGCAKYGLEPDAKKPREKWKPWQSETPGGDADARFYCGLWCKAFETNDPTVCQLLINESATSNNVLAAVNTVISALQSEDEFMLTISGHGETELPGWNNSFCLYPNDEELTFDQISNCLIRAAAKCTKVFCCIDACNAAGVYKFADQLTCDAEITDRREMPRLTAVVSSKGEPYKDQSKIAFIVASDYDQEAKSAQDGRENGLFTDAFKCGYETGASDADGDGFLDLHELSRYAYHAATEVSPSEEVFYFVQGRCYNKPLLLKTIVGRTTKAVKPDVTNPLNPYYVDFVNWIQDGTLATVPDPILVTNVADVATNALNRVPLAGGGSMTLADAFVAGYEPVRKGETNEPFRVAIAVTNGTPYLSWRPDRSKDALPMRTYTIRANTSFTNKTGWTTFPSDATPEQLKPYHFFKVDVKLRQ